MDKQYDSLISKVDSLTEKAVKIFSLKESESGLVNDANNTAYNIINECVEITFPLIDFTQSGLISIDGDLSTMRGESVKAGNVILHPKKFLQAIVKVTLASVSATNNPDISILLFADLVYSLFDIAKLSLSEYEASVIYIMSQFNSQDGIISKSELLNELNSQLAKVERLLINEQELFDILVRLKNWGCVEALDNDLTNWHLRERVKIRYGD